jgi:hypothetical protein
MVVVTPGSQDSAGPVAFFKALSGEVAVVRMMVTEPPLTAARTMARVGGAATSRHRLGVMAAVAVLIALPAVIFGIPALLGRAVLPGDDMTQNFPLRVLTGQQIRSGQLPLYNPYIWSGAPLLAGWNAGAAYPLTWLFAALPAAPAWTVNLIVTWAVAGTGMFFFLRALRLTSLASFLGALSFAFAGAMSAQVSHFGLVAGMSWVPVELLAVLRLSEDRSMASRLRWIAAGAAAIGLTVLAGEPRAVDDACVIVGGYAVWQVARLGRRAGPAALSVLAGLVLGACLGAVQWLPGLAAISTFNGAVHLRLAPAAVAAPRAGPRSPRRIRLAGPAELLHRLQPGGGDELRRHPSARRRVRSPRPPSAAITRAGVADLASHRDHRGPARARRQHPAGRGPISPAVVR